MTAAVVAACLSPTFANPPADAPVENLIQIELQIAGIGREGCSIEIKPAHPGCQFTPIKKSLDTAAASRGLRLPVQARSTAADRDCSFAITITQPGYPPRTFRRGLQLIPPKSSESAAPSQTLRCYLSSPALAQRETDRTRR
jgi:hypothetical protein